VDIIIGTTLLYEHLVWRNQLKLDTVIDLLSQLAIPRDQLLRSK